MRIAVLSDIHGNTPALEAVLEDIQQQGGADAHWIVGDLAAMGPDPIGTLEQMAQLPNTVFVRGNTDLRASYYLIEADERGHRLIHRRVGYDYAAVIAQLERRNHPGVAVLSSRFRGEKTPWWELAL